MLLSPAYTEVVMPVVEFLPSEQAWYDDKVKQANDHVERAKMEAANMIGIVFQKICESHKTNPPKNANPIRNDQGHIIGLAWGSEWQDFLNGKLIISGAMVPPQPPQPRPGGAAADLAERRMKKQKKAGS